MYLRLETLHRDESDALATSPRLVNIDQASHVHVETSPMDESCMLIVQYVGAPNPGRYYFGPLDMTTEEIDERLNHIVAVSRGVPQRTWSRSSDAAARVEGASLPLDYK